MFSAAEAGLDNHMMIDAIHEGKLKAMYVFGEEMSLVDSNANYVAMRCRSSTSLCAGDLLQRDLPLCGCDSAGQSRAWKRKEPSPAPSGASSVSIRS
jgi:hypothetical protein